MAKSREKIQQIGFWDDQVVSIDHDAVCLWAYENADTILRRVCPDLFDRPWRSEDIDRNSDEHRSLIKAFIDENPRPNPHIVRRTIEYVLRSYTGYRDSLERIVGYADVLIDTAVPRISPTYDDSRSQSYDSPVNGFEIVWNSERWNAPRILVEAKSVLPTVGELMRQIQLYRTAFNGHFVVVSPDDSYAEILAEQNVSFIQYPGVKARA